MRKRIRLAKFSSPGKIILSGEHAVVYGKPAILASIDSRFYIKASIIKKGIEVFPSSKYDQAVARAVDLARRLYKVRGGISVDMRSQVPVGCGMGSSAAFASSLSACMQKLSGKKFDLEEINSVSYELEKLRHGNPSGGDNTICSYGGFLWYRKELSSFKIFKDIKPKRKLPRLVIVNTGTPIESTKEMVEFVASKINSNQNKYSRLLNEIELTTKSILGFILKENSYDLGELILENESLLEKLGVVSKNTAELIRKIEKEGGYAKISGAGGRKQSSGAVIVYHKDIKKIKNYLRKLKADFFDVRMGEKGVCLEKN